MRPYILGLTLATGSIMATTFGWGAIEIYQDTQKSQERVDNTTDQLVEASENSSPQERIDELQHWNTLYKLRLAEDEKDLILVGSIAIAGLIVAGASAKRIFEQ